MNTDDQNSQENDDHDIVSNDEPEETELAPDYKLSYQF